MLRFRSVALLLMLMPALVEFRAPALAQAVIGKPLSGAFELSGWRYQPQGRDVSLYTCEQQCDPTSRVSYRLYDANLTLTQDEFRTQQAAAVKMLQERMQEGGRVEVVAITEDRQHDRRVLKAERLHSHANGRKEHVISSFVFGGNRPFSLISSADNEKAARDNFALFLPRVILAVQIGPR